jgi:hypothetical protein
VVDKASGPYTTIAAAMSAAKAGETIVVHAGVYSENVEFTKSGTATAYLTLQGDPGAILDGTGMDGHTPMVTITDRSYVRVSGFEIRNLKPTSTSVDATGILVSGAGTGVQVMNNKVHDIWASSASSSVNAHAIHIAGNTNPGLVNVTVSGNEIYSMKTGWSENLTVNGNVDGFEVSNNVIHDNNNIGIDIAGFYGMGPAGFDNARNGKVVGNNVYNITSANNPAYGGSRAADGIYVDGGKSVIIERNRVDSADIGIELASESQGKNTQDIIVRNNFVSRSVQGNIQAGGYDFNKGNAVNITIVNNTTWGSQSAEVVIQFNCSNLVIRNNVLVALASKPYLDQWGNNNTGFTVSNNLYYGASTSSPGAWPDSLARFVDPKLVNGFSDLHLQSGSPAVNAGIAGDAGGLDFDGQTRVNGVIDLGADEL